LWDENEKLNMNSKQLILTAIRTCGARGLQVLLAIALVAACSKDVPEELITKPDNDKVLPDSTNNETQRTDSTNNETQRTDSIGNKTDSVSIGDRTVLVYISGENSLWSFIKEDLDEMKAGSMNIGDNNLIVYVDGILQKEKPWVARIHKGQITDSVSIRDIAEVWELGPVETAVSGDPYSSDPAVMEGVIKYVFKKYPSRYNDYALSFWGHGNGWQMQDSIPQTRAFGIDYGDNGKSGKTEKAKWMNIPTMAKVLSRVPHLKYIFFDSCNMVCMEVAYELRHVTDYLIGSPAEIPDVGGPYETLVPAMFERETFTQSIIDRYAEQHHQGFDVPLATIKCSEMDSMAFVTKRVLQRIVPRFEGNYPDMTDLIFYLNTRKDERQFYDANDFILRFAEAGDYAFWKRALDKTVVHKQMAERWMINIAPWYKYYGELFTMSEEKFGGVSMYVPTDKTPTADTQYIKQMAWYKAAGYDTIGW